MVKGKILCSCERFILTLCLYNIETYGARDVLTDWERERYNSARERERQRERERSDNANSKHELSYWAVQQGDVSGNEGDAEDGDAEDGDAEDGDEEDSDGADVYGLVYLVFWYFRAKNGPI